MQIRRLTTALLVGLLLTLTLGTATAAAAPPPPPTETGCPASNQVLVVSDLLAMGYVLPGILDAEGNQDNLVCGLPLPEPVRQQLCGPNCPVPVLYLFDENDLPAQQ